MKNISCDVLYQLSDMMWWMNDDIQMHVGRTYYLYIIDGELRKDEYDMRNIKRRIEEGAEFLLGNNEGYNG